MVVDNDVDVDVDVDAECRSNGFCTEALIKSSKSE
jgi:hypothetical protein